jgi:hypothetical protein
LQTGRSSFGFRENALHFILNYDIKYRLDRAAENDEE